MHKRNKILISVGSAVVILVVCALLVASGLSAKRSDMTSGKVKITQSEYVRSDPGDPYSGFSEAGEPQSTVEILPGVYLGETPSEPTAEHFFGDSAVLFWDSEAVSGAMDKVITVTNHGRNDIYVRNIFMIPAIVKCNFGAGWSIEKIPGARFDGVEYFIVVATYQEALGAGKESSPSLVEIVIDSAATTDLLSRYVDASGNLKLYVASQAIQSKGIELKIEDALDLAFGKMNAGVNLWKDKN